LPLGSEAPTPEDPMHRKAMAVAAGLLAVLAVGVGGCGGSDGGSDGDALPVADQPYVAGVRSGLQRADEGAGRVTADQAICLAPRWVAVLRPARLRRLDVTPADLAGPRHRASIAKVGLDAEEADALVDAYGRCDVDTRQVFIDTLSGGRELPEADRRCLADALSDDLAHRLMAASLAKGIDGVDRDPELSSELFRVLGTCPGAVAATP
jgi:hypothetical protein